MHKQKYLHFIASFIIVLVLTIPFYTTSVYASINKVTVKGSDGIDGFIRPTDFLNFEVEAAITDEKITNDEVILGTDTKFDKCLDISNTTFCSLKIPSNGTESFELRALPFTIKLLKDDKTLDDSSSGSIIPDFKAPIAKLSTPQSKFSSQQDVVVDFEITDFSCDDVSCIDKCVGMKDIEFFTLDGSFEKTVDIATTDCKVSSSISIDSKIFPDGKNSVFARATDKFAQVSAETSVTFTIDIAGPEIIPSSFEILRKGISLSTFSSKAIDVEAVVNISGAELNPDSVIADLSALNPAKGLKSVKASCTKIEDDLSVCKWPIELNPKTSGSKNIVINASDKSGNKESVSLTKFLSLDENGPVVESLATTTTIDGIVIGKPSDNTIIAVFDEATGLSADEVFLHVDGSAITATSCSKSTSFVCLWGKINLGSDSEISIQSDTTDVLLNPVVEPKAVKVIVDGKIPVLKNIEIIPVGGITEAFPGFFKIGDKIAVVANLTEDNNLKAVADFSRFISGASKVVGSCENIQSDEFICTWLTSEINLQASDVVTFNFSDAAGNSLIVTKSLKTFGLEEAAAPDFWSNSVSCSPTTLDRSLGPLINQRVFCQVRLNPKSFTKPVSTVFIGTATCSGDTSIVQNVETFNTEVGSTSPIIKVTLRKSDLKVNSASLSCSFNIFSKIGSSTSITKNPEVEIAKIDLQFFNLPLGEVGEEVQRKIDEAKEDAEGIWELIGTLNKFMNYAKKICQMINTIYNVISILSYIYFLIAGAEVVCTNTGILKAYGVCEIIDQAKATMCTGKSVSEQGADGLKGLANKFCDYVTCKQTILWGPTAKNWINNAIPGAQYLGPQTKSNEKNTQILGGDVEKTQNTNNQFSKPLSELMDYQHNLGVALLFACIPGIIYGLDKYRQIKCLYADCLQNAVGQEGLPVTACEDQKSYATCKYIWGEVFAILPYTAFVDHFIGIVKNSMSNPFSVIGVAVSIACRQPSCEASRGIPEGGLLNWACVGARLLNLVGDAAQNVKNIIDEGFTIRTDYCKRLEESEKTGAAPISSFETTTSKGSTTETTPPKKTTSSFDKN